MKDINTMTKTRNTYRLSKDKYIYIAVLDSIVLLGHIVDKDLYTTCTTAKGAINYFRARIARILDLDLFDIEISYNDIELVKMEIIYL